MWQGRSMNSIQQFLVHKKVLIYTVFRFSEKGEAKKPCNLTYHSVAKDNFNKSKETTPTTSAELMVEDHYPQKLKSPLSDPYILSKFENFSNHSKIFFCFTIHKK